MAVRGGEDREDDEDEGSDDDRDSSNAEPAEASADHHVNPTGWIAPEPWTNSSADDKQAVVRIMWALPYGLLFEFELPDQKESALGSVIGLVFD